MSNLWESVQRGLEKASHEAARIGRAQRLRVTIDSLSRQINTENITLLNKTMDLFTTGQLTQGELLPICQELANLKQQFEQAQSELKALHNQGVPQQSPNTQSPAYTTPPTIPYASGIDSAPTVYVPPASSGPSTQSPLTSSAPPPPPNYTSFDTAMNTMPIPAPPPPPGVEPPTISDLETLILSSGSPAPQTASPKQQCPLCHAEQVPGVAYCHNCGTRLEGSGAAHLPTVRGGALEPFYPDGQETARADTAPSTPLTSQEATNNDLPPAEPQSNDGGD